MPRLFFGLGLDGEVAERLCARVRSVLHDQGPDALYRANDLHLTVAFLGEMDEASVASIQAVATEEFRGLMAPELRVGGEVDAFPSREAPRAVFAGVEETFESSGRLAAIRNRAQQVGLSHGWRPRTAENARGFRPHVTLARLGGRPPTGDGIYELSHERNWLPVDITLFESLDDRFEGGDRYRIRASWPLVIRPG